MRFSITFQAVLFVAGLAAANLSRVLHTDAELVARQDSTVTCNNGRTCSQCFGAGNILCGVSHCFNPGAGEQCCGDESYCIARNNGCCGNLGAGVTGRDGTPKPTSGPTATGATVSRNNAASQTSSSPATQTTSWDCDRSDTREDCCQRGGSDVHWCSGNVLFIKCYRPSVGETCCNNGFTCTGNNCCRQFNALATSPDPAVATLANPTSNPSSTARSGAAATSGPQAFALAAGLLGLAII